MARSISLAPAFPPDSVPDLEIMTKGGSNPRVAQAMALAATATAAGSAFTMMAPHLLTGEPLHFLGSWYETQQQTQKNGNPEDQASKYLHMGSEGYLAGFAVASCDPGIWAQPNSPEPRRSRRLRILLGLAGA